MADKRLVITVAPQKDICPHGSTYPRKAIAISITKIIMPVIQVDLFLKDLLSMPRLMWIKTKEKKTLTLFMWRKRSMYPNSTSRIMWMIELNAIFTSEL